MNNSELEESVRYVIDADLPVDHHDSSSQSEPGARSSNPVSDQIARARSSRAQAEGVRQNIAAEVLAATRVVYQKLISDGQAFLEMAVSREADAEAMRLEALKELAEARDTRVQAIAFEERIIKESHGKAREILDRARTDAARECERLRDQAKLEVQQLLVDAESIKLAAQEELQVQAIYAEASRLEAEAHEVLAKAKARLAQGEISRSKAGGTVQTDVDAHSADQDQP